MRVLNPNVSVDCVVFGYEAGKLKLLLIQRDASKNNDKSVLSWTLPGDLIQDDEDLDDARGDGGLVGGAAAEEQEG